MWLIIPSLLVIHVAICLLLVLIVLMQLPRSEGLGAAFGGGMTENMFGAQTTNVLSKFTVWLGVGFFVVTLALAMAFTKKSADDSAIQKDIMKSAEVAPAATPSAPAEATQGTGASQEVPVEAVEATVDETEVVVPTATEEAATTEPVMVDPVETVVTEEVATPAVEVPEAPAASPVPVAAP